jgi:hypothetical protein
MPRTVKSSGSKKRTAEPPPVEEALAADSAPLQGRVIERPDGFYWEAKHRDKGETHGPFATRAEADADLLSGGAAPEEGEEVPEALQEAESELGINEWIDPDTGGPAEDNVPRIEDH